VETSDEKLWMISTRSGDGDDLRKTDTFSFAFPHRKPQALRIGAAILSKPLQKNPDFSARFYCHHYYLQRIGFLKEETWS